MTLRGGGNPSPSHKTLTITGWGTLCPGEDVVSGEDMVLPCPPQSGENGYTPIWERTGWGTPIWDRKGWGTLLSRTGQFGVPSGEVMLEQVTVRTTCLLWFHAGGLSCSLWFKISGNKVHLPNPYIYIYVYIHFDKYPNVCICNQVLVKVTCTDISCTFDVQSHLVNTRSIPSQFDKSDYILNRKDLNITLR